MSATYFNKSGAGHSRRGQYAREQGAMAWSKLPANLRRQLSSRQAELLQISAEWHHAGKYANPVYVYYPEQVEAYWAALDETGITPQQAVAAVGTVPATDFTPEQHEAWRNARIAVATAAEAAEQIRVTFE